MSLLPIWKPGAYNNITTKVSQKKQHAKVRSGCLTCKKRHVKCDEARPTCMQCKRVGRECGGYQSPAAWIFEPSRGTSDELRGTQYYYEQTIVMIAGLFDGPFWRDLVAEATTTEPAIKHAVVALAAIHEGTDRREPTSQQRLAWQQCNKSIQLLRLQKNVPKSTLLIACAIFMYVETFQDHIASALAQLKSAYQILRLAKEDEIDPRLFELFSNFFNDHAFISHPYKLSKYLELPSMKPEIMPKIFKSVEDSRNALFALTQQRCVPESPSELQSIVEEQREGIATWRSHVNASRAFQALPIESHLTLSLLEAMAICSLMTYHAAYAHSQCVYDDYALEFVQLIQTCRTIYDFEDANRKAGKRANWSNYRAIHPVLATICLGSRNPRTRRTGLDLMRNYYNAVPCGSSQIESSAQVCELIMNVEESSCTDPVESAKDVPESARVRMSSKTDLGTPGGSWIRWVRVPYNDDGPYEEAFIPWSLIVDPEDPDLTNEAIVDLNCPPSTAAQTRLYSTLFMGLWRVGLEEKPDHQLDAMISALSWGIDRFSIHK